MEDLLVKTNNFKAMIMGILLIAVTTSLLARNTITTAVFAQTLNNLVNVTISILSKQTASDGTK